MFRAVLVRFEGESLVAVDASADVHRLVN